MKKQRLYNTGFLFSSPSFLSGAGTVMNLFGNYYSFSESETDVEADSRAIECDFGMIGQDISDAMSIVKSDSGKHILAE